MVLTRLAVYLQFRKVCTRAQSCARIFNTFLFKKKIINNSEITYWNNNLIDKLMEVNKEKYSFEDIAAE